MADIQQTSFVKQLAANDRRTRDAALSSLTLYLTHQPEPLPRLELLKLHKGLFYTLWLSDRPRTQQNLANSLSHLVSVFPSSEASLQFQEVFWHTMAREWNGIDVLRMDKFLLCCRRYLSAGFARLEAEGWAQGEVLSWLTMLEDGPLHPTNGKVPNGLRYHLTDIYLDELEKFVPKEGDTEEKELPPMELMVRPFERLVRESPTKPVRLRAKEMVLGDERLTRWGYGKSGVAAENVKTTGNEVSKNDEEEEESSEEEWHAMED